MAGRLLLVAFIVLGASLKVNGEEATDLILSPAYSGLPGNTYYNLNHSLDDSGATAVEKPVAIISAILGYFGNPKEANKAVIGQQRMTKTIDDASDTVKATLTRDELTQIRDALLEGKSLPAILQSLSFGWGVDRATLEMANAFDRRIEPYCSALPRAARALIAAIWVNRMQQTIHTGTLRASKKTAALISDEESALHQFALARATTSRSSATGTH